MQIPSLKKLYLPFIAVITTACFLSCHKDISNNAVPAGETPDLSSKIISSVSGFVTDENNQPVEGASIKVGTAATVLTDQYGYFEVNNTEVVKTAAFVTITKNGYFKGIKTWAATTDRPAFFRIKLIPKTIAGTINSSSGGNVTLSNGLIVALPANPVIKVSDNSAYTGNINVAVSWLNPEAEDIDRIMPGDLRGLDDAGAMKTLTTFGMTAVELTGDAGESLQIAAGKKATLTMPLSPLLSAAAPSTIPLWYFDESNGLWKEEGSATKTGNAYIGDVSHFTYWNYDIPNATVTVKFTIVDPNGNPVGNAHVRIAPPGSPYPFPSSYGYTNGEGNVSAFVEANTTYEVKIISNCNAFVHLQTFSTTTSPVDLGSIAIPATVGAWVSGTVTNCNGSAVTNGHMIVVLNNDYYNFPINNNGTYNFNTPVCYGNSLPTTFIAVDNAGQQQSAAFAYPLIAGQNTIGNIQACSGTSDAQYITYSFDGGVTNFTLTAPADSIIDNGVFSMGHSHIQGVSPGQNNMIGFELTHQNIAVGNSNQSLINFSSAKFSEQVTVTQPSYINITEAGSTGGYIAGNYVATLTGNNSQNTYSVTCSFRIRRYF